MDKIKRFLKKFEIPTWLLAVIAVFVFLVALFPVYRMTFYARIASDDFWYGSYVKKALLKDYTFSQFWKGMVWCVVWMRHNWQGTFSSAALMSLVGVFGDKAYFIGPIFVLTTFIAGNFIFTCVLGKKLLKASRSENIVLGIITTIAQVELMNLPREGIYWYNAAVHYVFMHGSLCILLAIFMELFFFRELKKYQLVLLEIAGLFFAVLTSGGNFSTILTGVLIIASIFLLIAAVPVLSHGEGKELIKGRVLLLAPIFIIYTVGFLLNVTAPGNAARQVMFAGKGIVESVLLSFKSAFEYVFIFTKPAVFGFLLLAVPIFWKLVKRLDYKFKFPWLVTVYSFCLFAASICPAWYGLGSAPLERTVNVVKFTYFFLLFINLCYWMGALARLLERKGKLVKAEEETGKKYSVVIFALACVIILAGFAVDSDKYGHFLSYAAFTDIHKGYAYSYALEMDKRVDLIINSEEMYVTVPKIFFRPWLLTGGVDDPSGFANWHGKWLVTLGDDY